MYAFRFVSLCLSNSMAKAEPNSNDICFMASSFVRSRRETAFGVKQEENDHFRCVCKFSIYLFLSHLSVCFADSILELSLSLLLCRNLNYSKSNPQHTHTYKARQYFRRFEYSGWFRFVIRLSSLVEGFRVLLLVLGSLCVCFKLSAVVQLRKRRRTIQRSLYEERKSFALYLSFSLVCQN